MLLYNYRLQLSLVTLAYLCTGEMGLIFFIRRGNCVVQYIKKSSKATTNYKNNFTFPVGDKFN